MTAGGTGSAIIKLLEADGEIPFAKGCRFSNMLLYFPGMNLMAGPAGSTFLLVDMYIMKIPAVVPEISVSGGLLDRG